MRTLATFCFSFAAGIFAAQYALPSAWLLPLAALFGALFAVCLLALRGKARRRFALITAALAFSLAYNAVYVTLVQKPNQALAGSMETLTLEICDYAVPTDYGAKVEVRVTVPADAAADYVAPDGVVTALAAGDHSLDVHLRK